MLKNSCTVLESVFFHILKFPKFLISIRKKGHSSPKNCLQDKKLSAVSLQICTQNVFGIAANTQMGTNDQRAFISRRATQCPNGHRCPEGLSNTQMDHQTPRDPVKYPEGHQCSERHPMPRGAPTASAERHQRPAQGTLNATTCNCSTGQILYWIYPILPSYIYKMGPGLLVL